MTGFGRPARYSRIACPQPINRCPYQGQALRPDGLSGRGTSSPPRSHRMLPRQEPKNAAQVRHALGPSCRCSAGTPACTEPLKKTRRMSDGSRQGDARHPGLPPVFIRQSVYLMQHAAHGSACAAAPCFHITKEQAQDSPGCSGSAACAFGGRLKILPLKRWNARQQYSTARPELIGKTAVFPRNDRPYGLKREVFQTEKALKHAVLSLIRHTAPGRLDRPRRNPAKI